MLATRLDVALSGVWLAARRPWLGLNEPANVPVKCSPSPLEKTEASDLQEFQADARTRTGDPFITSEVPASDGRYPAFARVSLFPARRRFIARPTALLHTRNDAGCSHIAHIERRAAQGASRLAQRPPECDFVETPRRWSPLVAISPTHAPSACTRFTTRFPRSRRLLDQNLTTSTWARSLDDATGETR
jgi:hypothetical protein